MTPRVSILIPVYNGANYLAQAIDSALAQTYGNVEVLVINDGSTDGGATEAIALRYGSRIRYIAKPNGGVSSALNRGIAEMTGEWFCWISHDDRHLPEKTTRQLAWLSEHPEARVLGCDFEIIDPAGHVIDTYHAGRTIVRSGFDLLETWVFGCALMIHRSCLDIPFNEGNRTTQDLEMWMHIVSRQPIHWLPEVLCQLRQHAESASRTELSYGADKDNLFTRAIEQYPITFFDPAATAPHSRAAAYVRLAEDAIRRQSWRGARVALDRAWADERTAWLRMARGLGPQRLAALRNARGFVRGKLDSLRRRLRR